MNSRKEGSKFKHIFVLTALTAGSLAISHASVAQQRSVFTEEVIVTAQKRQESIQDVPIAINAVSGDQLDALGVGDTDDIVNLFPNLSLKVASPINTGFSIRGVGTDQFQANAIPAVGLYMDEVSLVTTFSSQLSLFDMERIEVLRGPQNTLFGRNTTGGAVNFISKKPEVGGELNGFGRVKVGNEGRVDVEAAIGLPLGETTALRLAIQSQNRDGVFNNLLNGEQLGSIERNSGRIQLMWEPSDATSVLFNLHAGYSRGNLPGRRSIGVFAANGTDPCPLLATGGVDRMFDGTNECTGINPRSGDVVNISTADWNDVNRAGPSRADIDFEGGFVKVIHDFERFQLTSLTSYDTNYVNMDTINASATGYQTFYAGNEGDWEVFSQEIRLASTEDGPFRWIGGLYYSNEDDLFVGPARIVDTHVSVDLNQTVDIFSVYGQAEFDLSDKLTLTAGIRYTDDQKEGDSRVALFVDPTISVDSEISLAQRLEAVAGSGDCPPPGPCTSTIPVEQKFDAWGGKLGLDYRLNDDHLLFASYSRGFKSGSFDLRGVAAFQGTADSPTEPEFLDAYEIGFKSAFNDGAVTLNGAFFYYVWEDQQKFDSDPETGAAAFLNIPESELYGFEVELSWDVGNGWFTRLGAGILDSEVTDVGTLTTVEQGVDLSLSPDVSFNALITKDISLENSSLRLQTDFRYQGEQSAFLTSAPEGLIDSTFFLNARAAWFFGSEEQYELAVFADNITEEKTCADIARIGALTNTVVCTANPGMAFYGLNFQANF